MENKLGRSILAGIVATAIMTVVGVIAPYMGLPKMNPAEMLSGMLGVSPVLGWLMHFMIGIIFANSHAVALPIPAEAPVITTTLSLNSCFFIPAY